VECEGQRFLGSKRFLISADWRSELHTRTCLTFEYSTQPEWEIVLNWPSLNCLIIRMGVGGEPRIAPAEFGNANQWRHNFMARH
jgi:hypothetical protein